MYVIPTRTDVRHTNEVYSRSKNLVKRDLLSNEREFGLFNVSLHRGPRRHFPDPQVKFTAQDDPSWSTRRECAVGYSTPYSDGPFHAQTTHVIHTDGIAAFYEMRECFWGAKVQHVVAEDVNGVDPSLDCVAQDHWKKTLEDHIEAMGSNILDHALLQTMYGDLPLQ